MPKKKGTTTGISDDPQTGFNDEVINDSELEHDLNMREAAQAKVSKERSEFQKWDDKVKGRFSNPEEFAEGKRKRIGKFIISGKIRSRSFATKLAA